MIENNSKPFDLEKELEESKGLSLDLGCGRNKQPGFIGMDIRPLPDVDIVHNLEVIPYPLPDGCCKLITGSHIVEHLNPTSGFMLRFMDECWRLLKVGGRLAFSHPYGINSLYVQDPTHCNPCSETTWYYFCPTNPLYEIYRGKPFTMLANEYQLNGCLEVVFEKLSEEEGLKRFKKMLKECHPHKFAKEFPEEVEDATY